MSVTQNDVRNAYLFVLGREPESEEVIQFWAGRVNSWKELRQCFQDSEEYKLNNPARIAQASASHEDFYLKKCDGDFFWLNHFSCGMINPRQVNGDSCR